MRNVEHVKEILGGLAVLIGMLAIIAWFCSVNYLNNQKVQDMTRFCVEQGFDGWSDEGSGSMGVESLSGCVKS